ncbi:MAG TPA: metallophosphoesterase [Acidobacteriota bacterium]|nr:metallophosphoesterase [Acidobacteriota bacterium]
MNDAMDGLCLFVSDLHGSLPRYRRLFRLIAEETPDAVFVGGDLLPSFLRFSDARAGTPDEFVGDFLVPELRALHSHLGAAYPSIFLIMGNYDLRAAEGEFTRDEYADLWRYIHQKRVTYGAFDVFGYAHVPPTPFRLKDWDRYDVSRSIDPGCISPEDGDYSVEIDRRRVRYATIQDDLEALTGDRDLSRSVFLFHTPPYQTHLDRAALDGRVIDHVPLDVHVGSIAVRRMIERKQPLLTLHGHIHESVRLTGRWRDRVGQTHLFSGCHDGPELAVVRFRLDELDAAERVLLPVT